jgi:hypothetical protein
MTRVNSEQSRLLPWYAKAGAASSIIPLSRWVSPNIFTLKNGGYGIAASVSGVDEENRLSNLALSARSNLNHAFMRSETAKAIDFTLYCERAASGRRRVREVVLVNGYDSRSEQFEVDEIYTAS